MLEASRFLTTVSTGRGHSKAWRSLFRISTQTVLDFPRGALSVQFAGCGSGHFHLPVDTSVRGR